MPSVYAIFAVILPVSLGLGLVYLSSVGRIGIETALMGTVLIALVMAGAVMVRDAEERRGFNEGTDLEE
ncbi:MAG TPA: hypothetical protein VLH12_09875 [Usitatibacter sp.]|nr:hypothetical protein [Usitatibacter sp.]